MLVLRRRVRPRVLRTNIQSKQPFEALSSRAALPRITQQRRSVSLAAQAIFSIDIITLGIPMPCVGFRGFHAKLIVVAIAPIVLVSIIVGVNAVLAYTAPAAARATRRPASTSIRRRQAVWNSELISPTMQRAAGPCLFVLFFALPLVSSLAFRAFNCECFEYSGLCYLRADYELICGKQVCSEFPVPYTNTLNVCLSEIGRCYDQITA